MTKKELEFLGGRMKQLREKNGVKSLESMRELLTASGNDEYRVDNKSTLSRAESGSAGEKTIIKWAKAYCDVFGYSEKQTDQFLRGDRIAVPDTSALIKNPQLVDELGEEYNIVVIPDIVIRELDGIKNSNAGALGKKAWEIIRGIGYGDRVIKMEYDGDNSIEKDEQIIAVARTAAEKYGCEVQIITDDADYSAFLKGDETVTALHLREYMITKQKLVNMKGLVELDNYYADDYYFEDDILTMERFVKGLNRFKNPRDRSVVVMASEGYTYEKIGQAYGISRERVRQIIQRYAFYIGYKLPKGKGFNRRSA